MRVRTSPVVEFSGIDPARDGDADTHKARGRGGRATAWRARTTRIRQRAGETHAHKAEGRRAGCSEIVRRSADTGMLWAHAHGVVTRSEQSQMSVLDLIGFAHA